MLVVCSHRAVRDVVVGRDTSELRTLEYTRSTIVFDQAGLFEQGGRSVN
jgi:hypothetical protein